MSIATTLSSRGPGALTSAQLLALSIGADQRTARKILQIYSSSMLFQEDKVSRIKEITGLTHEHCVQIVATMALGRRHLPLGTHDLRIVGTAADTYDILHDKIHHLQQEYLYALYIDQKNRLIRKKLVTKGSLHHTLMEPREIFRPALECNASGVIIAHNHPSGDPTPSVADQQNTIRAVETGQTLGIPLLDHVIIATNSYYSFFEEGLLSTRKPIVETR